MRQLVATLALTLCVSAALAQEGIIDLRSGGTRFGEVEILDFVASDFSPERVGNVGQISLSDDVTMLSAVIGDAAGEIQQGTSLPATCAVGEVYILTNETNQAEQFYICETANTFVKQGGMVPQGRSGGQTLAGGTAVADELVLEGSSATDYTGSVSICKASRDPGAWAGECIEVFEDGLTGFTGASNFAAVRWDSTVVQDTNGTIGFPFIFFFSSSGTMKTAAGLTERGKAYIFADQNFVDQDQANTETLDEYSTVYSSPTFRETSSGTLTVTIAPAVQLVTPTITGAGVTLSEWNGVRIVNGAAAGGTFTTATGLHVEDLTRATNNYSVISAGAAVEMHHVGPVVVGADQAATTDAALEIVGNDTAVKLNSVTDANRPSTPSDGMLVHNSTDDSLEYYGAGGTSAWHPINEDTKCLVLETPAAADDFLWFKAQRSAGEFVEANCVVHAATNAVVKIKECDANGASCVDMSTDDTCTTTNTAIAFDDTAGAAFDENDWIRVEVVSVSGTPGHVAVCATCVGC